MRSSLRQTQEKFIYERLKGLFDDLVEKRKLIQVRFTRLEEMFFTVINTNSTLNKQYQKAKQTITEMKKKSGHKEVKSRNFIKAKDSDFISDILEQFNQFEIRQKEVQSLLNNAQDIIHSIPSSYGSDEINEKELLGIYNQIKDIEMQIGEFFVPIQKIKGITEGEQMRQHRANLSDELISQNQALRKQVKQLQRQLRNFKDAKQSLQTIRNQLTAENSQLKQNIKALQNDHRQHTDKTNLHHELLANSLAKKNDQIKQLHAKMSRLEKDLQSKMLELLESSNQSLLQKQKEAGLSFELKCAKVQIQSLSQVETKLREQNRQQSIKGQALGEFLKKVQVKLKFILINVVQRIQVKEIQDFNLLRKFKIAQKLVDQSPTLETQEELGSKIIEVACFQAKCSVKNVAGPQQFGVLVSAYGMKETDIYRNWSLLKMFGAIRHAFEIYSKLDFRADFQSSTVQEGIVKFLDQIKRMSEQLQQCLTDLLLRLLQRQKAAQNFAQNSQVLLKVKQDILIDLQNELKVTRKQLISAKVQLHHCNHVQQQLREQYQRNKLMLSDKLKFQSQKSNALRLKFKEEIKKMESEILSLRNSMCRYSEQQ